jgi:hypothetical protein
MFGITRAPKPQMDTIVVGAPSVFKQGKQNTIPLVECRRGGIWHQIETLQRVKRKITLI